MGGRGTGGIRNTAPARPTKTSDYKLTSADVTTLRVLFEQHDEGVGAGIARKLIKAETSGRTDVYLTFLEKDFAGYKLEGHLTDQEAVALEKILKKQSKEMFDSYWKERR